MGEEIFFSLRREILRGDLPSGGRLIEEKTAERFKASRTPVREAFVKLERDGLVARRAKGGFVIVPLDLDDVDEIMDLRGLLEGHAAALAARRTTPERLAKLKELLDHYGRALELGDLETMIKVNTEFHDQLYQASGGRRLTRMIEDLRDHFYRLRRHILSLPGMGRRSHQDHVEMVAAIAAGDEARAEALAREHIGRSRLALRQERDKGALKL